MRPERAQHYVVVVIGVSSCKSLQPCSEGSLINRTHAGKDEALLDVI
jgi:hypothetical protein